MIWIIGALLLTGVLLVNRVLFKSWTPPYLEGSAANRGLDFAALATSGVELFLVMAVVLILVPASLPAGGAPAGFLLMVVVMPLLETLLLQVLPAVLLKRLESAEDHFVPMWAFLGLPHALLLSPPHGVIVAVIVGGWLTRVFLAFRNDVPKAALAALTVHMVLNACCWALQFLL